MECQNIHFRRDLACTELSPPSDSLHSELTRCERRKGKVDQKSIKRQQIFRGLAGVSHRLLHCPSPRSFIMPFSSNPLTGKS